MFKEINEAYSTLSDKKKRENYDRYGERTFPSQDQYGGNSGQWANTQWGYSFSPGGGGFPMGAEPGFGMSGMMGDMLNEMFGQFFPGAQRGPLRRKRYSSEAYSPLQLDLYCTLEELCNGCEKKIRVVDRLEVGGGGVWPIERILSVPIQAGWRKGTKITFKPIPDFPKSIILTLKERKHRFYERKGNDLKWKCKLTKKQAIKGVLIKIPTLDGRIISFNTKGMQIKTGEKKRFAGQGMPVPRTGGREKGDIIVKFEITN